MWKEGKNRRTLFISYHKGFRLHFTLSRNFAVNINKKSYKEHIYELTFTKILMLRMSFL